MVYTDLFLFLVQFTAVSTFLIFCIFVFIPKLSISEKGFKNFFLKDSSMIKDFLILSSFYVFLFTHLFYFNEPTYYLFYILGFFLSMFGLIIALIGRLQLRKLWNPLTNIYDSKKILNTGIFSLIRHPIYAGRFLFFLGTMLMFNLLAVLLVPFYWDYLRSRLILEEEYLCSVNKNYLKHMQKVKRVFF